VDQAVHNKIVSFIWGSADDVLRDLFKRSKYPDVILPMCVIRRMDAVLEPTKQAVLDAKKMLDEAHITEQRAALCDAACHPAHGLCQLAIRHWSPPTSCSTQPTPRCLIGIAPGS
jgi:type I restriction enzyme M protein